MMPHSLASTLVLARLIVCIDFFKGVMNVDRLRLYSISDIHLGHHRTPTEFIIGNLERLIPNTTQLDDIDLILIGGDVFDRLLDFNSRAAILIKRWMRSLIRACKQHDVVLRILEGTPSHDHKQNQWWLETNEMIGADVGYIDELAIEHIAPFGIDILWVPDEWKPQGDDVWKDVCRLMEQKGLTHVDFCVIHGTMDHQVPKGLNLPHHLTQRYLDITRHYVLTGHIHQSAVRDRCLTNGSFDRLCHGDEGKKGFWDVTISPQGDHVVFIENRQAKVYNTINVVGLGERYLTAFEGLDLPVESHVRLETEVDSPAAFSFDQIKKQYGAYHWTIKTNRHDVSERQRNLFVDTRGQFTQTHLRADNLPEIVLERLRARGHAALVDDARRLLNEIMRT